MSKARQLLIHDCIQAQKSSSDSKVGRYLDPSERVVILYDAAVADDVDRETIVMEEVPAGINIFALLNIRVPGNVTDLDEWKVVFSRNSSTYSNISSLLEVRWMKSL